MGDVIRDRPHLFLGSRLKRLAEQMQGDVMLVTQRAGITIQPGQYPLLAALDEHGPQTIGELAQGMRMSQPAITKNVDRLVNARLIKVSRGDADRRQKVVSLSAAGRRMLELSKHEVWPLVEAAVKEVTDDLSGPLLEQVAEIEARLAARPPEQPGGRRRNPSTDRSYRPGRAVNRGADEFGLPQWRGRCGVDHRGRLFRGQSDK